MKRLFPLILLFLVLQSHGVQQQAPSSPPMQKVERKPQSGTSDDLATGSPKGAKEASVTNHENEDGTEFWPSFHGYRIKVTDSLLAIFTFLLAIFTLLLWCSTRALAKGADDTAKRQLRAYVAAKPIALSFFGSTVPVTATVQITNHGITPAFNVESYACVNILPFPLPANSGLPELPKSPSRFVLHANAEISSYATADRSFSQKEIADLVDGNHFRIYVYGRIKYVDIFRIQRTTTFFYSTFGNKNLRAISKGKAVPEVKIQFEPTFEHNEVN